MGCLVVRLRLVTLEIPVKYNIFHPFLSAITKIGLIYSLLVPLDYCFIKDSAKTVPVTIPDQISLALQADKKNSTLYTDFILIHLPLLPADKIAVTPINGGTDTCTYGGHG